MDSVPGGGGAGGRAEGEGEEAGGHLEDAAVARKMLRKRRQDSWKVRLLKLLSIPDNIWC